MGDGLHAHDADELIPTGLEDTALALAGSECTGTEHVAGIDVNNGVGGCIELAKVSGVRYASVTAVDRLV